MLAWGIFFITSQDKHPTFKARKWSLPLRKGGSKVAARPQSNQPGQTPPNAEAGEEEAKCRPGWNDIDSIPVGVDEEDGWGKRVRVLACNGLMPISVHLTLVFIVRSVKVIVPGSLSPVFSRLLTLVTCPLGVFSCFGYRLTFVPTENMRFHDFSSRP